MTDTDTSAKAVGAERRNIKLSIEKGMIPYVAGRNWCRLLNALFKRAEKAEAERDHYKDRAEGLEVAERALSGVAANSTDKKARFIATEALALIEKEQTDE